MLSAPRLALSWLTVLPVRADKYDRDTARTAIRLAPLVGALLGGVAVGALLALHAAGAPAMLAGLLTVGLLAVLTRGMHLDGLADTADGLGCYGPPERALAVMRDGGAGPFAVVALVITLAAQAVAMAALVPDRWAAVLLALVCGRAAFAICCTAEAARPDGLGALVAGTQPIPLVAAMWAALAGVAVLTIPDRPWLGPLAVLTAAAAATLLVRHTTRRFGGTTGDVLGASSELATTTVLVICTLAP